MWEPLDINPNRPRAELAADIKNFISKVGYTIVDEDTQRPWGGYFRFDEKNGQDFKQRFFQEIILPEWAKDLPMSPKILFTAPHKRLSWQYHNHRGEVWKPINGDCEIYVSKSDDQPAQPITLKEGTVYEVPVLTRHRLCGKDSWVIWAEMWIHTDKDQPSEEDDNVRLSDDFGR